MTRIALIFYFLVGRDSVEPRALAGKFCSTESRPTQTRMRRFGIGTIKPLRRDFQGCPRARSEPGGKFGFTVWAPATESPYAKIIDDAIAAHANMEVDLPEGPPHHLYASREEFRQALERAGFDGASLVFKLHRIEWNVPTARFIFDAERHAGVRTAGLLARQMPEQLSAIQAAIEKAVRPYARESGFAIPKAAHIVAVSKKL